VVAAVVSGDMSCNRAAKQFGVGISTAINWVKRVRETGSVAPGKMSGDKEVPPRPSLTYIKQDVPRFNILVMICFFLLNSAIQT
jgi:transposase-like protein